ncbi:sugar-binding transcriptional regulator [Fodinibius sediminis]|nr:sugar-binding transcriptional regulator [Fodinibius sediminis]
MYYDQNLNQQEIANRLHLSRPKVSRLLKQAREEGIVRISVISPSDSFMELEKALEKKFGLREALIVDADAQISEPSLKREVGSAAANYLHRTIAKGDVIGVSWGTTLQAMIDAMPAKKVDDVHVVQALGGVGPPEAKAHATDISRRLSQLLHSRLTLLPAPGIVSSTEAKKVLLSDRQVNGALDMFSEINTLCVGIGALETNPVLDHTNEELPPELYEEIINSKAVGDIALRFFDTDGKEIDSSLKDLVIGISLEEMKQVDTVVGIAGGTQKANVIRGALNGGLIDVLITDNQTVELLLSD